jgi:hypothetical protein
MSDLDILNQMIKEKAKATLEGNYNKKQVTLLEPQHPKSKVTIVGLPEQSIVIKADAFKSPDSIFNGQKGECKRADYIVVAEADNKKLIIIIEMKATKDSEKEIILQLTGAQCVVAYFREVGKAFWGKNNFLDNFKYSFISIAHTSISKRKTRMERTHKKNDRPDKMLKIAWPYKLQFNQLAGK